MMERATGLKIRLYKESDLDILKEITAEAFDGGSIDQIIERRYGLLNGENWRTRKVRQIDTDVARETGAVFIGEIDGLIVDYVTTWTHLASGIGHIPNIAVKANFRGKGGRAPAHRPRPR